MDDFGDILAENIAHVAVTNKVNTANDILI